MQLVLPTTILALATAMKVHASGSGFFASCDNTQISGHVLSGTCYNKAETEVDTSIDLNCCFANFNGQVIYAVDGNYASHCPSTEYVESDSSFVAIKCDNAEGGLDVSYVDFDKYIGNDNGKLYC